VTFAPDIQGKDMPPPMEFELNTTAGMICGFRIHCLSGNTRPLVTLLCLPALDFMSPGLSAIGSPVPSIATPGLTPIARPSSLRITPSPKLRASTTFLIANYFVSFICSCVTFRVIRTHCHGSGETTLGKPAVKKTEQDVSVRACFNASLVTQH